jgi:hypothetical protein
MIFDLLYKTAITMNMNHLVALFIFSLTPTPHERNLPPKIPSYATSAFNCHTSPTSQTYADFCDFVFLQ